MRQFLHDKIREKIDDPQTAERLIPKGYPFGCKRNPLDSGYYETFNLPHVHLVDVKTEPDRRDHPGRACSWRTEPSTSSTRSSTPPGSTP